MLFKMSPFVRYKAEGNFTFFGGGGLFFFPSCSALALRVCWRAGEWGGEEMREFCQGVSLQKLFFFSFLFTSTLAAAVCMTQM